VLSNVRILLVQGGKHPTAENMAHNQCHVAKMQKCKSMQTKNVEIRTNNYRNDTTLANIIAANWQRRLSNHFERLDWRGPRL
jgi:hypothetical protein